LEPEFEEAAEILKIKEVSLAKVDATESVYLSQ
jgi:hypothetical protein